MVFYSEGWGPLVFLSAGLFFLCFRLGYHLMGFTFCRHPAVAGILAWIFLRDENLLWAAVFFELFWLDLFHTGVYTPPDALFAYLVFLPLALYFQRQDPAACVLLLAACLPLAGAGAWLERRLRRGRTGYYYALNEAIARGGDVLAIAGSIARAGFCRALLAGAALYTAAILGVGGLFTVWTHFAEPPVFVQADWIKLLCFAAVGGLLALRLPSAITLFLLCAAFFGIMVIFAAGR